MPYEWYGQMVTSGGDDPMWNRFDDLLNGYHADKKAAYRLIADVIRAIKLRGYVIDSKAESDLQLHVEGFIVQRVTRFEYRYNLNQPESWMPNIILMLTLPYPGDIPYKTVPVKEGGHIRLHDEMEVLAYFTGGRHEDYDA